MSQALPADLSSPSRELEKALLLPLTLVAIPVAPLLLHSPAWQLGAALARASRQAALTAGTPRSSALWSYATRQILGAISGAIPRAVCCLSPSADRTNRVTRAHVKKPEPAQDSLAEQQAQGV